MELITAELAAEVVQKDLLLFIKNPTVLGVPLQCVTSARSPWKCTRRPVLRVATVGLAFSVKTCRSSSELSPVGCHRASATHHHSLCLCELITAPPNSLIINFEGTTIFRLFWLPRCQYEVVRPPTTLVPSLDHACHHQSTKCQFCVTRCTRAVRRRVTLQCGDVPSIPDCSIACLKYPASTNSSACAITPP